ncbi:hypothetical protein GCM10023160_09220 [Brachybacterium paraconglomeratum]
MGFDWEQILDADGDDIADVYDGLVHDAPSETVGVTHRVRASGRRWGRHRPL